MQTNYITIAFIQTKHTFLRQRSDYFTLYEIRRIWDAYEAEELDREYYSFYLNENPLRHCAVEGVF